MGTARGQILAVRLITLVDTFLSFDLEYLDDTTLSYLKVLLLSKWEDIQEGVDFSRWAAVSLQFATVDKRLLVILTMFKPLTISISDCDSNVEPSIGLKPFENVNYWVGKIK